MTKDWRTGHDRREHRGWRRPRHRQRRIATSATAAWPAWLVRGAGAPLAHRSGRRGRGTDRLRPASRRRVRRLAFGAHRRHGARLLRRGRPGGLTLQAAGVLAFGSTALAALFVAPELGAYLVAFALLGHAAWDAYHYLRDRVVARSYAEFCGVLDLLVGAAI